jgi:Flp pilus assembly protein TadD
MTMGTWIRAGLAALAIFATTPTMAAVWRKAESENFLLYSRADEKKIREQLILLEDYHEFLRSLTGVDDPPSPNKLPIYMVRGRDELRIVRNVGEGTAGIYVPSPFGIAAFADEKSRGLDGSDQILQHEIAHHFMLQYRPTAYPAWYVEGFAEYVMTATFKPNLIEFGLPSQVRISWLKHQRWLPVERVLFSPPPRPADERALFYAQSWLLSHYMLRDAERRKKFAAYMNALATGTESRKAFAAQFGDLKAFDRAVETYARRDMTFTKRTRASAAASPAMTVTTLPASAEDLLLPEATMHIGVGEAYAAPLLARIRKAAAKFPDDAYARRVLAEAEVQFGDGAKGEALLDALLKDAPKDAELMYLKGLRHLIVGRAAEEPEPAFKQARTWFARAHKADPNHFPTLVSYAESLRTDERFDSDNTMNILMLAHQLAPQVDEVTMRAANLLMIRDRYPEAERLLLPLASHPHNEGLAAAAGALLEKARAKGKALSEPPGADEAGVEARAAGSTASQ